ncbi:MULTISPECIES: LysE family translocator [Rhodomicrobium]|uniref:LysE family translocator n=1 Tax=Rhodomicrobium TaxID=1068 RepID=UPI000B4BD265|nr:MULTISPECIES: LysE family translocator [Rhodomicrobium]
MSIQLYLTFVLACFVLAITPGPNMSLFLATGTAHGTRAALMTVLGSATGLSILVLAATLGMGSVMSAASHWFDVIRWVGAAYLVWLGYKQLRAAFRNGPAGPVPAPSRGRWFFQGAAVSLSNPKVLLFLGAFFPQFIDPASAVAPQLALMAVTFVLTIAAVDATLATAVGSAKDWFTGRRRRVADGASGLMLVCGGLWLAARRT